MESNILDIEALRRWVKKQPNRAELARATGIPYQSINNFIRGAVSEPRLAHLRALLEYKNRSSAA